LTETKMWKKCLYLEPAPSERWRQPTDRLWSEATVQRSAAASIFFRRGQRSAAAWWSHGMFFKLWAWSTHCRLFII